jgi:phosphoribosylglycinamide formyltransferase-1
MKKVAIFASGSGTNAQNITEYFKHSQSGRVNIILTNNPEAYVLKRAIKLSIPTYVFDRETFYNTDKVLNVLKDENTDFIVLAGFLWLVPGNLIKAFPNRIINIHPALLPKYGGKGMYGMKVHNTVLQNKDKESGITIHYVNEQYDEGSIIFQTRCPVKVDDTPESLAQRVHQLEYKYFPKIVEKELMKLDQIVAK